MPLNEKMQMCENGCGSWRQKCSMLLLLFVVGSMLWGCRSGEAEKWAKQLSSTESKAREEAALALQKLGPKAEEAVPALIGALSDKEAGVVLASVRALRAVGRGALPARPALMRLLKKADKKMKQEVGLALRAITQHMRPVKKALPSVQVLVAALEKSKNPKKLARALVLLGQHQGKASAHVQKMVDALDHADKDVRRAASTGLGLLGPKVALVTLRKNVKHKSLRLRNNVIRTIGLFGPHALEAQTELLEAAKSKEPKIRRAALWSLGSLGPKSKDKSLDAVKQALKDPEWLVRGAACLAYGNLMRGAQEAFPVLRELLKDKHPHVRYIALEQLLRFGPKAQAILDQGLKDQDEEVRALALQGGAGLRLFGAGALSALVEATKDKSWQVRLAAVQALGSLGSDARPALPQLQKLMSDKDIRVRRAVLQVFLSVQQAKAGAPRPTPPRAPVLRMPAPRGGTTLPSSAPAQRRP